MLPKIHCTLLKSLHPQERSISRYLQFFIAVVNAQEDAVELLANQPRSNPQLVRLLKARSREMQERKRMARSQVNLAGSAGSNPMMSPERLPLQLRAGDEQWGLEPNDYLTLIEDVGDRLLKCIAGNVHLPQDIKESISIYIRKEPWQRRVSDLEDLQMDDPASVRTETSKMCLVQFESNLISFLRQQADPDADSYLANLLRKLRAAGARPRYTNAFDDADLDDDDADDGRRRGIPWWLVVIVIAVIIAALIGVGIWFFRKWRRENRAKIAAAAAGLSAASTIASAAEAVTRPN
jgi:hypothetical protein